MFREEEDRVSAGRFVEPAADLILPPPREYALQRQSKVAWPPPFLTMEEGADMPFHFGGGISVAPPTQLTVTLGQTVRVTLRVYYTGPAQANPFIRVAFGDHGISFNEDTGKYTQQAITIPLCTTEQLLTFVVDVYMGGSATGVKSLYAKILNISGSDVYTPYYDNVLNVLGAMTFRNFAVTDYSIL